MQLIPWDSFYKRNKDTAPIEKLRETWARINKGIALDAGIHQPEGWKTWTSKQKREYIDKEAKKNYYLD
jgi:hypothetical protein